MRASARSSGAWQWAATGKHPVAKDYFEVGSDVPILKAFSAWVEKGYHALSQKARLGAGLCSWRFWAKGSNAKTVVCGLGKDSSDSVGRPYPLLIVGTGPLMGWADAWDLLPTACENTWNQMEYLSARRFDAFKDFETEIQYIKPPHARWDVFRSETAKRRDESVQGSNTGLSPQTAGFVDRAADLAQQADFVVCLDAMQAGDVFTQACLWHAALRAQNETIPNAVFMGANFRGTYLAVFKRALAPNDFVRLWAGDQGVEDQGGPLGKAAEGHSLET